MRIGDIIGMAALVVVILVTLILAGQLQTVANTMYVGTNASAPATVAFNNSRTQLFNNTFTGLNLASVAIIISAAVGILGLVIGALSPRAPAQYE